MILVYGHGDDPPTERIVEALQDIEAPYVFLDQRALTSEGMCVEAGTEGIDGALFVAGERIPLGALQAVFARPLEPELRAVDGASAARASALHELLMNWLDIAPARVVNRPYAMQANASKPLQLQLIGEAGFLVPETLVTSDADEARAFWHAHGRVIFKSTSGIRSIVRELDEAAASRLALITSLPVQFQAYVPGVDVRVHVVGSETYAAEIRSVGIDYRYARRDGQATELNATSLSEEVAGRCVALASAMDLPLAGVDLRRRPDGEYVCFEVNPMPAFSYFQGHTGLPIAEAVAGLLSGSGTNGVEVLNGSDHRKSDADRRYDHRAKAASHS